MKKIKDNRKINTKTIFTLSVIWFFLMFNDETNDIFGQLFPSIRHENRGWPPFQLTGSRGVVTPFKEKPLSQL